MRLRPLLHSLAALLLGFGVMLAPAFVGTPPPARTGVALLSGGLYPTPTPDATPTPSPSPSPTPGPTPAPPPSPTPAPPPTAAPTPEPGPEALAHPLTTRLDTRVADTALSPGAHLAVTVLDQDGATVFDRSGDEALLPASTQKLVVAAAALGRLGADFRFRTEVAGTAPVEGGVLHGDLVLHGSMDPALATPTFAEQVDSRRPRTPIESLADQLVAAGVTAVTGGVLGDPSVLPHEPQAPGWLPRYVTAGDATLSSGLTVDGGRRLFVQDGTWHSTASPDPASEAAAALASLLRDRGVQVGGGTRAVRARPETGPVLAAVSSPPLLELLRHTVQRSDNHLADAIFRALGRADGDGSWTSSSRAVRAALAPLGLDLSGATFADGSGLSREDRLSARLLAELDRTMTRSTAGRQWRSVLAVSGESGTLRRRLVGTVAEGRLRGKTGSLRDVRALSGAVEGPDGTRYHFAVVGNGLAGGDREAVRALQDDVVLALAEDLYGCVLTPAPPEAPAATPSPAPEEPVMELVCAA